MDYPALFTCPRRDGNLRLTEHACAQSFLKRQGDQHHPCHRCEIGAGHAGASLQPERGTACAWCGNSGRLIFSCICVSCFNRCREIVTGKFRRGKPPKLAERLNCYQIEVQQ